VRPADGGEENPLGRRSDRARYNQIGQQILEREWRKAGMGMQYEELGSLSARRSGATWWNVPNQLTTARLILAIIVFALISFHYFVTALVVFLFAAATDWVDGYWARRYGQVTKLGRILDPFVDKFIICGVFIFLAATPHAGILAWMAVLVVARELLVTALRGQVEGEGGDFSAKWSGKWKMVFQCAAVALSLWTLSYASKEPAAARIVRDVCIWLAILTTIYSGGIYVVAAIRALNSQKSAANS
jgi:CDP-diacylglycerol--glycerol-3-phosphate 3-phosphatidyltransferase